MSFMTNYFEIEWEIHDFTNYELYTTNEIISERFYLEFGDRKEEWQLALLLVEPAASRATQAAFGPDANRVIRDAFGHPPIIHGQTANLVLRPEISDSLADNPLSWKPGCFNISYKSFIIDRNRNQHFVFENKSHTQNTINLAQIFHNRNTILWQRESPRDFYLKLKFLIEVKGRSDFRTGPKLETLCADKLNYDLNEENLYDTLHQAYRLQNEILFVNCVRFMRWKNIQLHDQINNPIILRKIINNWAGLEFQQIRISENRFIGDTGGRYQELFQLLNSTLVMDEDGFFLR